MSLTYRGLQRQLTQKFTNTSHTQSRLYLISMHDVLHFEHNRILRQERRKKSSVPVQPHLLELQPLRTLLTTTLPNNRNHSDRDANIRLLALVPKKPKIPHILSVNLARPVVALNLDKVHPIMPDAFENGKQPLHPCPHLLASVVDGVVLVVERHVFGVELEAGADVVAF